PLPPFGGGAGWGVLPASPPPLPSPASGVRLRMGGPMSHLPVHADPAAVPCPLTQHGGPFPAVRQVAGHARDLIVAVSSPPSPPAARRRSAAPMCSGSG